MPIALENNLHYFAITIHKSKALTSEKAVLDIGGNKQGTCIVLSCVAFSKVKTLKGLALYRKYICVYLFMSKFVITIHLYSKYLQINICCINHVSVEWWQEWQNLPIETFIFYFFNVFLVLIITTKKKKLNFVWSFRS